MAVKNAITHLYEFCQRKNSKVTLADLKFDFQVKNKIAEIVYEDLLNYEKSSNINGEKDDSKDYTTMLNEYLQDKNTNINVTDVEYKYLKSI
ncbi:hypothetical protein PIROE2DRAFT_18001 [Piromyces sp. E2]|nr:hypothetical protein PIROE2DRAFT_18001 [Piromyces sp. E2]|eukprot:OUM57116.1 hypothetical protein PIROE2DRAFT_18001 [Piromyces sp. E2]